MADCPVGEASVRARRTNSINRRINEQVQRIYDPNHPLGVRQLDSILRTLDENRQRVRELVNALESKTDTERVKIRGDLAPIFDATRGTE